MLSRLVTGLLATLAVQLVQWPFFIGAEIPGGVAFLLFHAALVGLLLVPPALIPRIGGSPRRLAAAYVCLPLSLSLWPESMDLGITTAVAAVAVMGSIALVAVAGRLRFLGEPRAVPLAAAGAALGVGLMTVRHGVGEPWRLPVALSLALVLGAAAWRRPAPRFARLAWLAGLVPALLLVPSLRDWQPPVPPEGGASEAPPIVLVVLDAVRADHLRMYGAARDTMPNLEALARGEGFRSRRSVANATLSLPAHASIFTGLYPPGHGAHMAFLEDPQPPETNLYPLPPNGPPTLAELLSEAGYWSVGLSGNYTHLHPAMGLARGFDVYRADSSPGVRLRRRTPWCMATVLVGHLVGRDRTGPCQPYQQDVPYRNATEITDEALATLDAAGDRPLFLFLNYFDAHKPFLAPSAYAGTYPGELGWNHARRLDDLFVKGGEAELTAAERAHLDAAYDAELSYLDAELGRLLDRLRAHPRWQDMLLVVTSDHGMSLGEHGLVSHEAHLFDPMVRVPLVIKSGKRGPARPRDNVDTVVRQSVDLFPLVLDAAGIEPPAALDGVEWSTGRETALAWLFADAKLASRNPDRWARELRMAESRGWKLIESSRGERWGYDLRRDAEENDALAPPSCCLQEMHAALGDWPRFDSRRHHGEGVENDVLERLRSLGYVE